MDVLRTPDDRFLDLPDWPYEPRYADVGGVRMAYVDEGPAGAPAVLLLHGEPTWSFLYRKVLGPLLDAGLRVVVPDLIGFGRSDKPVDDEAHTYAAHVGWVAALVTRLDLRHATLVCQDWGGLIGLRVLTEDADRFAAVVAANTGLPTGDHAMPEQWWAFRNWVAAADKLPVGFLVNSGCVGALSEDVLRAYDAPFPDESYKAGPRMLPQLIPTTPDDPATEANRAAWAALAQWDKPFLCAFSDGDPMTRDAAPVFTKVVPGAALQPHTTIEGAGHFLQEDAGERLGEIVAKFVASSKRQT